MKQKPRLPDVCGFYMRRGRVTARPAVDRNPMLLRGLLAAYREATARCGPGSIAARLWRECVRGYLRTGRLT